MLCAQEFQWLFVDKVAFDDVMQMSHAEKERRDQYGLGKAQVRYEQRNHAAAEDKFFGERTQYIVAPKAQVAK